MKTSPAVAASASTSSSSGHPVPASHPPPVRQVTEKKRKNRWGSAPAVVVAPEQQQQQQREHSSYIEPYVSDSEAIAALLAASTDGGDANASVTTTTHDDSTILKRQRNSSTTNKWQTQLQNNNNNNNNGNYKWGKEETVTTISSTDEVEEKEKPNFAVSGALATDTQTGNIYKGILLKFHEPPEARVPAVTKWRLYVFTSSDNENKNKPEIYHISKQSAYLFGREHTIADVPLFHPSCSKQHAVLQYRAVPYTSKDGLSTTVRCKPYLMDLQSVNGTFINGHRVEDARYYELQKQDVITFGSSSREYVLMAE